MHLRAGLLRVLGLGRDLGQTTLRQFSTTCSSYEMSKEYATGCNIFQDGEDPKLRPDEEYPDWLWGLVNPPPTAKQLRQKVQEVGTEALPYNEYKRLQKLERKARIKEANRASMKK